MLPTSPLPWERCPYPLTPLVWVSDTSNFPSKQTPLTGVSHSVDNSTLDVSAQTSDTSAGKTDRMARGASLATDM